jgi:AcrR family transcriptional regulator
MHKENLNDTRSSATKARLINSTIESLIEIGFTKTTGVEVCRRAQLTRGALNHHFPDFSGLLVETLQSIYLQLLEIKLPLDVGLMEHILQEGHARIIRPEFKAVIELWLASKNDKRFGLRLLQAMELGSEMFSPQMVLEHKNQGVVSKEFEMIHRTISEALIGIGLGRAIGEGEPLAHESMVLQVLQGMAQTYDHQQLA